MSVLFVVTFPNEPNSNSAAWSFSLFLPTTITASAPFKQNSSYCLPNSAGLPDDQTSFSREFLAHVLPSILMTRILGKSPSHWPGDLLKRSSTTPESTSPDWL